MEIKLNGQTQQVESGTTVADVVADLPQRGVAVAVNSEVIPRQAQPQTTLAQGDIVEVVTAVQGG